jgi:hypothetical protein
MDPFPKRRCPAVEWIPHGWAKFDERSRDMLARRRANQTLEAIGRAHGLTRERARQIIQAAERTLVLMADALQAGWRDQVFELLGELPAVADESLGQVIVDPGGTARYTLVHALGIKHPRVWGGDLPDFWSTQPDALDKLFRELADHGPYRPHELASQARELGIPNAVPLELIAGHPKSPLVHAQDGAWIRRRARGRDAAYLWLADEGESRRAEEIAAALGRESRAVAESLRRDERFRQIRPEGTWVLADWPLPSVSHYTNALDVVIEVLTDSGPISRAKLIAEVIRRYPVSQSRVQQCLISDRVGMTSDGMFDLVERGAKAIEEPEPRHPESIAVDPSGQIVGVKISVDKDALRGSGIVIHPWLTWYLGLRLAPMSRVFAIKGNGESGHLTVSRSTSAAQVSSLRAHIISMGLTPGCQLVLMLHLDESSVTLRHACESPTCPAMVTATT